MIEFKLVGDFIELDNLLKALNLAGNGAEARRFIQDARVSVNGTLETRVRRKIKSGDVVSFESEEIRIV